MEEYSEANKPVPLGQTPMETNLDDEIRLYRPKKKKGRGVLYSACLRVWRFLLMIVAFFLIYYCLYRLYVNYASRSEGIPALARPEETSAEETIVESNIELPLIINESKAEFDVDALFNEEYSFGLPRAEGVTVIIVNTHSSERVSSDITVKQLSEDLLKILQSYGISAYFDGTEYDAQGMIGAYSRMADNVRSLNDIYNEAVVVIDIHDSDSGAPLTFTVGTADTFAWQENLHLACSIYKRMKCSDCAFRLLPSSLGQDNGLLSVNIGIGGADSSEVEVRALLAAFADALTQILKKEPLAQTRGSRLYSF